MRRALLPALAALLLGVGACDVPSSLTGQDDAPGIAARVVGVTDGDTLRTRTADGTTERVRLIGIDAPETSTLRNGSVECGGREAAQALRGLVRDAPEIRLVTDPGQDERDRFGRLLAYVEPRDGGPSFQRSLLRAGWARVYVYGRDPFGRVDEFRDAASAARVERRGVWASCGGNFRRPLR